MTLKKYIKSSNTATPPLTELRIELTREDGDRRFLKAVTYPTGDSRYERMTYTVQKRKIMKYNDEDFLFTTVSLISFSSSMIL